MTDYRRSRLSNLRDRFVSADPASEAGICCFTCKADDLLMWSHYADSHRGVCLLYEIPHDYFMRRYTPEMDKDFFLVGAAPVRYGNNVFYNWLTTGDLDAPHIESVAENAMTILFTSKAPAWSHEEEFRIITRRPGKMTFESSFLRQVILGMATPEEYRKRVVQIAKSANKSVVISEVRRSTDSDFAIAFPEIATDL